MTGYESKKKAALDKLAQPAQEPSGWMLEQGPYVEFERRDYHDGDEWTPFYLGKPPQRPWVGLTDEEVKNLCLSVGAEPIEVRLIEAKLKEKNEFHIKN